MVKSVDRAQLSLAWLIVAVMLTTCFGAVVHPSAAFAGTDTTATKPERVILDPLGIDLPQLAYVKENVHLSIGDPAHGGLAWRYIIGAQAYGGNVVEFLSGSNKLATVKFEGNATVFIYNASTGTYVNASGTGGTLTKTASNYIFTDDDGTIYTYSWTYTAGVAGNPSYNAGPILSAQKPDGTVLTFTGATVNGAPSTVISNRGYGLKTVLSGGVKTVYAVNMSVHTCDASLNCDAYDGSITTQQVYDPAAPLGINGSGYVDQVTDALGNSWEYFVDYSADFVTQTTETFGPKVLWYYKDPNGYSATINYDGDGRITTFVDPRGTFTFDYNGQTLAQAAVNFDRTVSAYDPSGTLMYTALVHWKQSTLDWIKDALGHQTNYTFATTSVVISGVGSHNYTRLMAVAKPEGNSATYAYDARGNVTSVTNTPKSGSGLTATTVYANYDATCTNPKKCNKPNWTEDARGNYTYYTYDPTHGGVTVVQSPADSSGITPETVTTWAQFTAQIKNSSGTLVNAGTIWLPQTVSACATAVTCDGTVNQAKTTTSYATYNLLPSSVTAAAGDGSVSLTTSQAYDAAGNVTSVDGPRTDVDDTSYSTYDAIRRSVYEIGVDPDGTGALKRVMIHHLYTHTLENQAETGTGTSTNGSDFVRASYVTTSFDTMNRKTLTAAYIDGNGTAQSLTQFNYNSVGLLKCTAVRMNPAVYGTIASTDACTLGTTGAYRADRITYNTYNAARQLTEVDQAYGVAGLQRAYARYTYSNNGFKQTEMDADGNKTHYVYDGFDRLSQVQYPSTAAGSGGINTTDYEQFGYDANGNKTSWRRRDGQTIAFTYDKLNREIIKDIPGGTAADVYTDYDLMGHPCIRAFNSNITTQGPNCTSLFTSLGSTQGTHYKYNGIGWLAATTDMNGRTVSYAYNQAGVRNMLWYPDSNSVGYTLDNANRMTAIGYDAWSGLLTQSYDNLGHLYGQGKAGGTTTYTTDNLGRLTGLTNDLAATAYDIAWTFTYNPAGQVYQTTASSTVYDYKETPNSTVNQTYDGLNRDAAIVAVSGGYDARGNLANEGSGGRTFTYDVENRLLSAISTTANLRLVYDPEGRLTQYSSDGGTTYLDFLYDGVNLIGEYPHGSTTPNERYIHGYGTDNPLVWLHGSGTSAERWFYTDYHGSVIGWTDSGGNLVDLYKYGPYGEPKNVSNVTSFTGARFRYTGQTALPEASLYYYKARVYDPIYGRFLQTDPIGSKDNLNLYAYTAGNPVNRSDPSGLLAAAGSWLSMTGEDNGGDVDGRGSSTSAPGARSINAFGKRFVTSNILGDDAHNMLALYASEQGDQWFSNVMRAPDGTIFDGRPDLGNIDTLKLWELKTPLGAPGGVGQLFDYSISSFGKYTPARSAPSFFVGNDLVLPGAFGVINYTYQVWGVITYKYNTDKDVVKLPGLVPLPGPATAPNVAPAALPIIP